MPTLKDAQAYACLMGFTITKIEGEYRVKHTNVSPDPAEYFATDLDDAIGTLRAIYNRENRAITVSAIQEANRKAGGYFFNRDTLEYFGDTLSNFDVHAFNGDTYLYRIAETEKGAKRNVWLFDTSSRHLRYIDKNSKRGKAVYARVYPPK